MNADQDILIENNKQADIEADAAIFLGEISESVFDMVALGGSAKTVIDKLGIAGSIQQKKWKDIGGKP